MNSQLTKFVILCTPRTGSNMLCTLLNSHPEILCHHEIFNPGGIYYALHLRNGSFGLGTIEERTHDPTSFLHRIWEKSLGFMCVGFKLNRRQNETVLQAVLNDKDVKKIVLRRNNRIKPFVSWLISEKVEQWEVYRQSDLLAERPKIELDLATLYENMAFVKAYYAEVEETLQASNHAFLRVTYEKLFSTEERLRILRFLGVSLDVSNLKVESVKQNPNDLRELLSNFTEVEAALRGTDLEDDLHSLDF